MKTILQFGLIAFLIFGQPCVYAQSTSDNNNPLVGKFLGYNAGQNLEFRTNNTTRMQLMQSGNSNVNGFNINRSGFLGLSQDPNFFTTAVASPFSLLHLNGDNVGQPPQQLGYRNWMRYGVVFTHNRDLMYVGQRRRANDVTDAVISWSDNPSGPGVGPDVLTFLFTGGTASSGSETEIARMIGPGHTGIGTSWSNASQPKRTLDVIRGDSRPQMRLTYQSGSDLQTNPGLYTDFQASENGNLHIKPADNGTTRATTIGFLDGEAPDPLVGTVLDVGRGLTRIRQLPQISPDALIIGYRYEDVNIDDEDNFLGRLEFPDDDDADCFVLNGDGQWTNICDDTDCRWIDIASPFFPGQIDMYTGLDPAEDCYRGKVGVGIDLLAKAKFEVKNIFDRDEVLIGTYSNSEYFQGSGNVGTSVIGVLGEAESDGFPGSITLNIGVQGIGNESRWALGVDGRGNGYPDGVSTGIAMGVRGSAGGGVLNIGVYGEVSNPSDVSGYFSGGSFVTSGPPIIMSDESVKNSVENVENASSILAQLSPKTYYYQSPENRPIAFHEGLQYGFIAQEVQDVLPSIVHMTTTPELTDSTGIIDGTSVDLLGVQYSSIIPILVAGFNEQTALISGQEGLLESQTGTIAELESQIADQNAVIESLSAQIAALATSVQSMQQKTQNCCEQKATGQNSIPNQSEGPQQLELGQNIPNPFVEITRIDFYLPAEAEVILEISDAQGRPLRTLIDGKMGSGSHTTSFEGSGLAAGVYYYSLYANGELITKRMLKL